MHPCLSRACLRSVHPAALALAACAWLPWAAHANLLVNGGFDAPLGAGDGGGSGGAGPFVLFNAPRQSIPAWTLASGSVEVFTDYAGSGNQVVDMTGLHTGFGGLGPGSLLQGFATTAGTRYAVHFLMGGGATPTIKELAVAVTGQAATVYESVFSLDTAQLPAPNALLPQQFEFTALDSWSTLRFTSLVDSSFDGPHLDSVLVTAVPEAGTWALMLAGLGGLAARTRRRRPAARRPCITHAEQENVPMKSPSSPSSPWSIAVCSIGVWLSLAGGTATAAEVYNTGVDALGQPLVIGASDAHWTVMSGPGVPAPRPAIASAIYSEFPTRSDSTWIWASVSAQGINQPFTFRTSFELRPAEAQTLQLSGVWSVDNIGYISLNGSPAVGTGALELPDLLASNYQRFHEFAITGGFVPGLNTLDFITTDFGGVAGLNVGGLTVSAVPEPPALALLAVGLLGVAGRLMRRTPHWR